MNLKIFGILGVLAFATVSVMSWADDTEEVEVLDDEEFDEDEFEDDDEDIFEEEEEEEVEETRTVASRLSCDDIKKRITELRKEVIANPDLNEELETMLVKQRSQCASRARGRPVHNYENINPVKVIDVEITEPEPEVVEEVKIAEPKPVKKTKKELEAEQIAQEQQIADNLAKGLCADGTKPNKYGCCTGEKFKEVSQMKFACCPEDGDCVEPRKKK